MTHEHTPSFLESDIQTREQRTVMSKRLANKVFEMTVVEILAPNSWLLRCPEFDSRVYVTSKRLQKGITQLQVGDRVSCKVATQLKLHSRTRWQFFALEVSVMSPDGHAPTAVFAPKPIQGLQATFRDDLKRLCAAGRHKQVAAGYEGWVPDAQSLEHLEAATIIVGNALNPGFPRSNRELGDECRARLASLPESVRAVLFPKLDAFFLKPRPAAARQPTVKANSLATRAQPTPSASAQWNKASALRVDSWDHATPLYTIYIDESWPVDSKEGILGGIVWRGDRPDRNKLAIPKQHVRALSTLQAHLDGLKAAGAYALPFIVEYTPPQHINRVDAYEWMLQDVLLVLLGWVLPRPPVGAGQVAGIQVVCESISRYPDGHDHTEVFRGILRQAGRFLPERYGCWGITRFHWRQKDERPPEHFTEKEVEAQGYLGLADMLCYAALNKVNPKAQELAEAVGLSQMRTYFRLNPERVKLLDQAERAQSPLEMSALLDLLYHNRQSCLADRLIDNLSLRATRDPEFVRSLIEALDREYSQKNPNLRALDHQYALVMRIIGSLPSEAPIPLQLAALAAELKRQNHFGDPLKIPGLGESYLRLRTRALENGYADQVAHVDLNLAVRQRDRFEFDAAHRLTQRLLEDELLFSLHTRVKMYSSAGQDEALTGQLSAAIMRFDRALALLQDADLSDAQRGDEWHQTAIYRAIVMIDAGQDDRKVQIEKVLKRKGFENIGQACRKLGAENTLSDQYHHYLVLRLLMDLADSTSLVAEYLGHQAPFKHLSHPWELIAFYRAWLLWPRNPELSRAYFDQALSICLQPHHGVTLQAIAAMIASIAWGMTGEGRYREKAVQLIDGNSEGDGEGAGESTIPIPALESALPTLKGQLEPWRELLDQSAPAQESVLRAALKVLPFNYR
ncbi:MAG: hypothetical protein IPM37_15505 [Hahellaceae bacterium]|nr:hypothetical protein [Hahellaceae bacterium]